jgi:hypothetical protein
MGTSGRFRCLPVVAPIQAPPASGGNVQAGTVLKVEYELHGILSEGWRSNDLSAPLGLERSGDDLRSARSMLVDEDGQRQVGKWTCSHYPVGLQILPTVLLLDHHPLA